MARSIVMSEWSRDNEVTPGSRDNFLWHQMLLSLLYDDVLAKDETLLCSRHLPDWFRGEDFRLFEEIVDCGGISILKRPLHRYPRHLMDLVQEQPIAGRRMHLVDFGSTRDGFKLQFDERQIEFHKRLEALLHGRRSSHRFAGERTPRERDLMKDFAALLVSVLTGAAYRPWLSAKFRNIPRSTAEDFASNVVDPDAALERISRLGHTGAPRYTPRSIGGSFTSTIAVQLAATYGPAATELEGLIETVFARCFNAHENAEGRYGRRLRSLPLPRAPDEEGETVHLVDVRYIWMKLPQPRPGFARHIAQIRERRSGRELRAAMDELGAEATFDRAREAWRAVADDLASLIGSRELKSVPLQTRVLRTSRSAALGLLAGFGWDAALGEASGSLAHLAYTLGGAAFGASLDLGADMGTELLRALSADMAGRELADRIAGAIDFSCVRHPTVLADRATGADR